VLGFERRIVRPLRRVAGEEIVDDERRQGEIRVVPLDLQLVPFGR
jgi:hypothetical protein